MTQADIRRVTVEAAHVTSVSTVRRAIRTPEVGVGHSLTGMRAAGLIARCATVEDALSAASRWMLASRRSEFVAVEVQLLQHVAGRAGGVRGGLQPFTNYSTATAMLRHT